MITLRKSDDRGHFDHGWLQTHHTFSFASYHDPDHMGFRTLRVINEDVVQPDQGFGTHPHRDMEIVTYVVGGAVEHRDSMGNGTVIRAGEVQRMTAGTGVTHSEFNPSLDEPLHLLQIWVLPERIGLRPGYEQKKFEVEEKRGQLRRVVGPMGSDDGSLGIHQDVSIYASVLDAGESVTHQFGKRRGGWVQVISGEVDVQGTTARAGDGVALVDEPRVQIAARQPAEFLLFDLA